MKHVILFIVFFCLSFPVKADTEKLCNTVNHIPRDDVTYRPSPNVVPADLNAVPIELGDVEIPLTAFLVQELELETSVSASKLGSVIIKENGVVLYNGKDISNNVTAFCATPVAKAEKQKPKKPQNQDGQAPVEPVELAPLEPIQKAPLAQPTQDTFYGGLGQEHINKNYNN